MSLPIETEFVELSRSEFNDCVVNAQRLGASFYEVAFYFDDTGALFCRFQCCYEDGESEFYMVQLWQEPHDTHTRRRQRGQGGAEHE